MIVHDMQKKNYTCKNIGKLCEKFNTRRAQPIDFCLISIAGMGEDVNYRQRTYSKYYSLVTFISNRISVANLFGARN